MDGRRSIHDIAYTATGAVRKGFQSVSDKRQGPGARHPVVRTHAVTKRKSLYLGRQGYGYILGLPVEDGGWAVLNWREHDDPNKPGSTVWAVFEDGSVICPDCAWASGLYALP